MQLAKGSAEDLPSGLAANFRAFGFSERICNGLIKRVSLKKTCACLAVSVASRTCIKTSTRLIVKTNFKIKKLMKSTILLLFLFKRVIIKITTTLIKMSMAHTDGRNMRPYSIMSLTCRVVVMTIGCVLCRVRNYCAPFFLCKFFLVFMYGFNRLSGKKVISDKIRQRPIKTRFNL